MRGIAGLVAACALAAASPLLPAPATETAPTRFPGWPTTFEGDVLHPRAASAAEARFAQSFPGRIGSFAAGGRAVLLRYVEQPTRKLHPAADCYRAGGHTVEPGPLRVDADGRRWSCFEARVARTGEARPLRWQVCESIRDAAGRSWSDVSSWYWSAAFGDSAGPWWTTTVAEPLGP